MSEISQGRRINAAERGDIEMDQDIEIRMRDGSWVEIGRIEAHAEHRGWRSTVLVLVLKQNNRFLKQLAIYRGRLGGASTAAQLKREGASTPVTVLCSAKLQTETTLGVSKRGV